MEVTHVTFDCYGTLIDWRRGIEEGLGALLRRRGLPPGQPVFPTYAEIEAREELAYRPYRAVLRDTALAVARRFGLELPAAEAEAFAAGLPRWPPFGDAAEVLRELGRRGYRRVILSNVDRDLLAATLGAHGLEVDGAITAEEAGSYKPAPGHWTRFLEAYGVDRAKVLHVAQSPYHDIVPAARLGLATAWVDRDGDVPPAAARPTYVLRNLRELLRLLPGPPRGGPAAAAGGQGR